MIAQESFESHLKIAIEFGREFFAWHPDGEFIPMMFLVGLTNGQQKTTVMVLPDALDAHKYRNLRAIGAKVATEHEVVLAAFLLSEAWISEQIVGLPAEEYVAPVDDPERKEALIVSGIAIDQRSVNIKLDMRRDAQGSVSLGEQAEFGGSPNGLLQAFWAGYTGALAEIFKT